VSRLLERDRDASDDGIAIQNKQLQALRIDDLRPQSFVGPSLAAS